MSFRSVVFTFENDIYEYRNVESIKFFHKIKILEFYNKEDSISLDSFEIEVKNFILQNGFNTFFGLNKTF